MRELPSGLNSKIQRLGGKLQKLNEKRQDEREEDSRHFKNVLRSESWHGHTFLDAERLAREAEARIADEKSVTKARIFGRRKH